MRGSLRRGVVANRERPRAEALRPRSNIPIAFATAVREFGQGIRHLQNGEYARAAEIFQKLTNSPAREIADRARIHLQRCLEQNKLKTSPPRSAEEYYLQGVAALNDRQTTLALELLSKSDKLEPNQDHIQYALAAAYGIEGRTDEALRHLEAAIRLRPANRVLARNDGDFQAISDDPRFRQLLAGGSF